MYTQCVCVDRRAHNLVSTTMASLSALKTSASEEDLVRGQVATSNTVSVQKFPIRRLKPAIHKFQKVLQVDLDRLEKHKNNIDKVCCSAAGFMHVSVFLCVCMFVGIYISVCVPEGRPGDY